jgi:hypothetical protein
MPKHIVQDGIVSTFFSWGNMLLKDKKESMPRLNDAVAWNKWKAMGRTTPSEDYNNALFLYCAIQKAHEE